MNSHTFVQEINQLHANICGALADPNRILILYLLSEGALNVNTLVEKLDLPQPTVSRHLKILRDRGLVTAQRDGQSVYYELADDRVIEALEILRIVLGDRLVKQRTLAFTATREFALFN